MPAFSNTILPNYLHSFLSISGSWITWRMLWTLFLWRRQCFGRCLYVSHCSSSKRYRDFTYSIESNNFWIFLYQYRGSNALYHLQASILLCLFSLSTLAILFYLGQHFHSSAMELSVTIYQSEWHRYPRSVRRFVLLMMQRSQRPFYLSAYGIMSLNLENFVGVSTPTHMIIIKSQKGDI